VNKKELQKLFPDSIDKKKSYMDVPKLTRFIPKLIRNRARNFSKKKKKELLVVPSLATRDVTTIYR